IPIDRRRPGSTRAYPVPHADPGPAPSPNRARQAAMNGMKLVGRGRLDGPRGPPVTEMFDRCRNAVTAAAVGGVTPGAPRRTSPGGAPGRAGAARREVAGVAVAVQGRRFVGTDSPRDDHGHDLLDAGGACRRLACTAPGSVANFPWLAIS